MGTYFTDYIDDTTEFKAVHMNAPLDELDAQIVINTTAVDALEEDINQTGLAAASGEFVLVSSLGAFIFRNIVCLDGEVVTSGGNVVVN